MDGMGMMPASLSVLPVHSPAGMPGPKPFASTVDVSEAAEEKASKPKPT